jgi:hypothetical protein
MLTSHLQPFVLRISGTGCEDMQCEPAYVPFLSSVVNVTGADWDEVANFVKATGANLVFGFNQLVRNYPAPTDKGCNSDKACTWNGAKAWIEYNLKIGLHVYGYELGNEPGCYLGHINLPGSLAAQDYAALKKLLTEAYANISDTAQPKLIGPDMGGCKHAKNGKGSLDDILQGNPPFDIIAFHHYSQFAIALNCITSYHWHSSCVHCSAWRRRSSQVYCRQIYGGCRDKHHTGTD